MTTAAHTAGRMLLDRLLGSVHGPGRRTVFPFRVSGIEPEIRSVLAVRDRGAVRPAHGAAPRRWLALPDPSTAAGRHRFLQFQQSYTQNYALISAACVIMLLPMLVLFLALQRRFVAGFTATGLKG